MKKGACVVCSTLTNSINKKTGKFVFSDEYKYKDNENKIQHKYFDEVNNNDRNFQKWYLLS